MTDEEFKYQAIERLATIQTEIRDMRGDISSAADHVRDMDKRLYSAEAELALHASKIQQQAGIISLTITVLIEIAFRAWAFFTGRQ